MGSRVVKIRLIGLGFLALFGFTLHIGSANAANGGSWALGWPGYDLRGAPCDGVYMNYGPYNYINPEHKAHKLPIVESYHFTRDIETSAGVKKRSGAEVGYVLRAFPNHHRALYAMIRHQLRFDEEIYLEGNTPAECYFEKAIVFVPEDLKVYQLYAYYLGKKGHHEIAIKQYQRALAIKPQGHLHYQLGKTYLKTKQYDEAVEQAKLALELDFKKMDLKKKLQSMGKWPE